MHEKTQETYFFIAVYTAFFTCRNEVDVLLSQFTQEDLARFSGDAVEPVEERYLFSSIAGSEHFIERFTLNSHEQNIVGSWGFLPCFFNDPRTGDGLGWSIEFFPNRFFTVTRYFIEIGGSPHLVNRTQDIVGTWKVERGRLQIRFICRIIYVNPYTEIRNEMFAVEHWNDLRNSLVAVCSGYTAHSALPAWKTAPCHHF